jgi:hypothetical protein
VLRNVINALLYIIKYGIVSLCYFAFIMHDFVYRRRILGFCRGTAAGVGAMVAVDVERDIKTFLSSFDNVPSCAASVAKFVGIVIVVVVDNPPPKKG